MATDRAELLGLTAGIVAAHVANNAVAASDLPTLIEKVYAGLSQAGMAKAAEPAKPQRPAVPIRASVKPDHLVCLEDGKPVKLLKRYLREQYGLTPAEYRAKWNLPAHYPMVAPSIATQRSEVAKRIGLGRTAPETPETKRRKLSIAVFSA